MGTRTHEKIAATPPPTIILKKVQHLYTYLLKTQLLQRLRRDTPRLLELALHPTAVIFHPR